MGIYRGNRGKRKGQRAGKKRNVDLQQWVHFRVRERKGKKKTWDCAEKLEEGSSTWRS